MDFILKQKAQHTPKHLIYFTAIYCYIPYVNQTIRFLDMELNHVNKSICIGVMASVAGDLIERKKHCFSHLFLGS